MSPREKGGTSEPAGRAANSSVPGAPRDGASEAERLLQLLPSADERELMDGSRSFLTSVLRSVNWARFRCLFSQPLCGLFM